MYRYHLFLVFPDQAPFLGLRGPYSSGRMPVVRLTVLVVLLSHPAFRDSGLLLLEGSREQQ